MSKGNPAIGLRLPPTELERLDGICMQTGKTRGEVIRAALQLLDPDDLPLALTRRDLASEIDMAMEAIKRYLAASAANLMATGGGDDDGDWSAEDWDDDDQMPY